MSSAHPCGERGLWWEAVRKLTLSRELFLEDGYARANAVNSIFYAKTGTGNEKHAATIVAFACSGRAKSLKPLAKLLSPRYPFIVM